MQWLGALVMVALVACGDDKGEPIAGDLTITYGDEVIAPTVGAAIPNEASGEDDPTKALVLIGTRGISCGTSLATTLRRGTYVSFPIDRAAGLQTPSVSVIRVDSNVANINGATGEVTIDAVGDRIIGSVTSDMQDPDIGTIAVTGTFDVIRCF